MATHSSVLAWRIPGTREPCGLPSIGSHRVGHDWSDLAAAAAVLLWGFPGGSDGKESACNAGDSGSIPGSGRFSGEGKGNPLQYSCLKSSMDRGAWWVQSIGSQRVGHNWVTNAHSPTLMHYPRIYHSLPGIILVMNTKLFSLSFSCSENIGSMVTGTFSVLFITASQSLVESLLILRDSGNICWVNKDILLQVPQEFSGWS